MNVESHSHTLKAVCEYLQANSEEAALAAAAACNELWPVPRESAAATARAVIDTGIRLECWNRREDAENLYRLIIAEPLIPAADRASAHLRLASILATGPHSDEAVQHARLAMNEAAGNTALFESAAMLALQILSSEEKWAEALPAAEAALSVATAPQSIQWVQLHVLLCSLHTGHPAEACAAALLSQRIEPGFEGTWMHIGWIAEQHGYFAISRSFYERIAACESAPLRMRTNAHYRLGLVLDRLLSFDLAEYHLRQAVEAPACFPEAQTEARLRLANLRYLMDDFEAALPHYDQLRTNPEASAQTGAEARLKYGICLLRLNRYNEATRALQSFRGETDSGEQQVKVDLLLAEIAEAQRDWQAARHCYSRIAAHPSAEPLTRAAALARLQQIAGKRS